MGERGQSWQNRQSRFDNENDQAPLGSGKRRGLECATKHERPALHEDLRTHYYSSVIELRLGPSCGMSDFAGSKWLQNYLIRAALVVVIALSYTTKCWSEGMRSNAFSL